MAIELAKDDKRMVILVIEDEPLIRMVVSEYIADAGFEALEAANADIAIEILERRGDIRAIFTDINMPGSMDGLKLARAVRDRWPPIHIIITSGIPRLFKG
jgi:CheY-like chemotaxis protein